MLSKEDQRRFEQITRSSRESTRSSSPGWMTGHRLRRRRLPAAVDDRPVGGAAGARPCWPGGVAGAVCAVVLLAQRRDDVAVATPTPLDRGRRSGQDVVDPRGEPLGTPGAAARSAPDRRWPAPARRAGAAADPARSPGSAARSGNGTGGSQNRSTSSRQRRVRQVGQHQRGTGHRAAHPVGRPASSALIPVVGLAPPGPVGPRRPGCPPVHRPAPARSAPQPAQQLGPVPSAPVQQLERVRVERLGEQVEGGGEVLARHREVRAVAAHRPARRSRPGTAARPAPANTSSSSAGRSPASSRALKSACAGQHLLDPGPSPAGNAASPIRTAYGFGREPCTDGGHPPGRDVEARAPAPTRAYERPRVSRVPSANDSSTSRNRRDHQDAPIAPRALRGP